MKDNSDAVIFKVYILYVLASKVSVLQYTWYGVRVRVGGCLVGWLVGRVGGWLIEKYTFYEACRHRQLVKDRV